MATWTHQNEINLRALAILRVSSGRQKDGVSHHTQESEIARYCKDNNLDLVETRRIVESAKRSIDRKKYNAAIDLAIVGSTHFSNQKRKPIPA